MSKARTRRRLKLRSRIVDVEVGTELVATIYSQVNMVKVNFVEEEMVE